MSIYLNLAIQARHSKRSIELFIILGQYFLRNLVFSPHPRLVPAAGHAPPRKPASRTPLLRPPAPLSRTFPSPGSQSPEIQQRFLVPRPHCHDAGHGQPSIPPPLGVCRYVPSTWNHPALLFQAEL